MLFFLLLLLDMHDVCELMQINVYVAMQMVPSFLWLMFTAFLLIGDIKRENVKGFPTSLVRSSKVINAFCNIYVYIEKHSLSCLQTAWWWCWRDNIQFTSLGTTFYLF